MLSIATRLHNLSPCAHAIAPHTGLLLDSLSLVTPLEVNRILKSIPSKSSNVDFISTSLLKSSAGVFSDIMAKLANLSFSHVVFPTN